MKKDYTKGVKKKFKRFLKKMQKVDFGEVNQNLLLTKILDKLTIFARNEKIIKSVRVLKQNLHSDNIKEVNDLLMQKRRN